MTRASNGFPQARRMIPLVLRRLSIQPSIGMGRHSRVHRPARRSCSARAASLTSTTTVRAALS